MAKDKMYTALTSHLENSTASVLPMTFQEIEEILGKPLPPSASVYPAFWANSSKNAYSYIWMDAGYLCKNASPTRQIVTFIKGSSQNTSTPSQANPIPKKYVPKKIPTLPVTAACEAIEAYYHHTETDPHGRYQSWCHCYQVFTSNRCHKDPQTIDYLALHLGFYLASWGMYRSSFLLQKDYQVHIPIVEILLDPKYDPLLGLSAEGYLDDTVLDLLDEVSQKIRQAYAAQQPALGCTVNSASDTLVTKILLGTLGCTPAYDRFYVETVKQYHISSGTYHRRSLRDGANYYLTYQEEFEALRTKYSNSDIQYPPMKLMDMCMWYLSFEKDTSTDKHNW